MTDDQRDELEKRMNIIITQSLWACSTDPSSSELTAASHAYSIMKIFNLKVKNEESVKKTLGGENIYEESFLDLKF